MGLSLYEDNPKRKRPLAPGCWHAEEAEAMDRFRRGWTHEWRYEDPCGYVRDFRADIERRTIHQTHQETRFLCARNGLVQGTIVPQDKASSCFGTEQPGRGAPGQ